jgi:ribonuclease HI
MADATFVCGSCGVEFSLPAQVVAKYPNWTPGTCMDCRNAKEPSKRSPGAARGRSVTRALDLTTAQVLERFTDGPRSGIFTDGSCQTNPGPGGWGAVFVRDGEVVAQRFGADPATTNNRMELTAMIEGLLLAPPAHLVDIYSDSQLVVNTLTAWAKGWEARGWKRKEGEVMNLDLVQRAYALALERPNARIQWIRAHDGSRWNEYADALASAYQREEA